MRMQVQEMWAYVIAAAQMPGGPMRHNVIKDFQLHPPFDPQLTREVRASLACYQRL